MHNSLRIGARLIFFKNESEMPISYLHSIHFIAVSALFFQLKPKKLFFFHDFHGNRGHTTYICQQFFMLIHQLQIKYSCYSIIQQFTKIINIQQNNKEWKSGWNQGGVLKPSRLSRLENLQSTLLINSRFPHSRKHFVSTYYRPPVI